MYALRTYFYVLFFKFESQPSNHVISIKSWHFYSYCLKEFSMYFTMYIFAILCIFAYKTYCKRRRFNACKLEFLLLKPYDTLTCLQLQNKYIAWR
jgi:hypothetical protein